MKFIFLFLLTITLAFSSERKIILGTYTQLQHASNTLVQANRLVDNDQSLKIFMDLNHLSIQVEKIKQYNVVSIKILTSYREILYIMSKFKKNYSDLYVLPPYKTLPTEKISTSPQAKVQEHKVQEHAETFIEKTYILPPYKEPSSLKKSTPPEKKTQESINVTQIKSNTTDTTPAIIEKSEIDDVIDPLIDEDLYNTSDTKSFFNYQIAITIIIAIILLMILINTIIKLRQSSKKDKFKLYN